MMQFRKPIRDRSYNYALAGNYFVTTFVKNRVCCFGVIKDNKIMLNQFGDIAASHWVWLHEYYPFVKIGASVVMPNHVHAIIQIHAAPGISAPRSLPQLMSAYKSKVSAMIHKNGLPGFSWHRSYHDHIIRTQHDYDRIATYIKNNPRLWTTDRFHSKTTPP